ncbi:MAG: aldehyde dehydrogenase family protein [Dehalococcoidia bacterium]|nr:aldehyde dehydrogenase family protein [Dehalococcoidia bacterium]
MLFQSLNPATEEVVAEFQEATAEEVEAALAGAVTAFESWRRTSFQQRGDLLRAAAKQLRGDKQRLAGLITLEMGKPIIQAEAEIEKCAGGCEYYATHAESFLADLAKESSATESYVVFDPIGTVFAIMPWNFPFWQVFRFAAPALMAGNTMIVKHAASTPQCALAIDEVFRKAGLPDSVYTNLFVNHDRAAEIIEDERIRAVTLTGSERAGTSVASTAGRVVKKSVLELGGSDPFIVLPDADLEASVSTAVTARYQNAGQSCIAAKRFIVADEVYDAFVPRFVEAIEKLNLDDPAERSTNIGPLARGDLLDGLEKQVHRSLDLGATVLTGGYRPDRKGYYYAPTVLTDVKPGMPAFDEEVFGPVAAVIRAGSTGEAISLANQSRFGLGSSVWTRDIANARRLAREIEAGMVFINGLVASEPALPFGGVKHSGHGRELSEFGIREFVNVKTVWIGPRRDDSAPPPSE